MLGIGRKPRPDSTRKSPVIRHTIVLRVAGDSSACMRVIEATLKIVASTLDCYVHFHRWEGPCDVRPGSDIVYSQRQQGE